MLRRKLTSQANETRRAGTNIQQRMPQQTSHKAVTPSSSRPTASTWPALVFVHPKGMKSGLKRQTSPESTYILSLVQQKPSSEEKRENTGKNCFAKTFKQRSARLTYAEAVKLNRNTTVNRFVFDSLNMYTIE